MRKLHISLAVGALALGLVAAPSAVAKKAPKQVPATVSLFATPTTITPATAASVTATGNVAASSSCRKDRTVRFSYTNTTTGAVTPLFGSTVVTGPNGDFSAVLPKPTDTAPANVTLRAGVGFAQRKVGSNKKGKKSKKGRQFHCLAAEGQTTLTVTAPVTP